VGSNAGQRATVSIALRVPKHKRQADASRMLLYYGFLHYQRKLPIWQCVVYVGKDKLQMDHQLQTNRLSYSYQLIDLKTFSYETFLESGHSQEVILAILADFRGEPEELIAGKIIAKLQQLTSGQLELGQRALQLVRLAVLRNLGKVVFNLTKKMAITIDIKEDDLYQEVYREGLQEGLQVGLQKGLQKACRKARKKASSPPRKKPPD
jgi:predicted transposase YdaD